MQPFKAQTQSNNAHHTKPTHTHCSKGAHFRDTLDVKQKSHTFEITTSTLHCKAETATGPQIQLQIVTEGESVRNTKSTDRHRT